MSRYSFFFSLVWQNRFSYLTGVVTLALTLWMSLAIPRYLQQAIDILSRADGSAHGDFINRLQWILLFAVAIIFTRTLSRMVFFTPGRKVEFDLKNRLLAHLTTLQRSYFSQNPTGAIISRINNDINGIRLVMGFGLLQLTNSVATLSLAPYYMYRISPTLTLYSTLPVIAGFMVLQIGVRMMRSEQMKQMTTLQNLSDFIVESYNGIEVVKGCRTYPHTQRQFGRLNGAVMETQLRLANIRAFFMPILSHLVNGLKVMLVLLGGLMVIRAEITMGEFLAYLLYLTMMVPPLMGMTFMMFVLQRGFTSMDSIQSILETPPDLPPLPQPQPELKTPWQTGLAIRGLTYAYPERPGQPVLTDIGMDIRPGEIVGLFGQVGSGKTTLVNLINRYLAPPEGTVWAEGVDTTHVPQQNLRRWVVTVTQDPFLFSDTIRENLMFGGSEDEDALSQTVEDAALRPDLDRFPQGLDTLVGEKGITLSGGQKQRIALGRAMLKPCELLILDDPLSAVDHETERSLIRSIYGFHHSRSLLIVSHRTSVLEKADRIVVLENGRVVDTGTHGELINREGSYRRGWLLQTEQDHQTGQDRPRLT
ncbi:MAG: ABC transporter ATP-binding protein/permease [Deltaproteobacteria bacterium]|nr:ABC transporter ATP-binding protein/permease [Deltaproteobacteria bacterium]